MSPGSKNSVLRYNFVSANTFEGADLSLISAVVNSAWFNISSALNNNTFTYKWLDERGDLTETVTITIQDGYYDINNLNEYIQNRLYNKGHYIKHVASGNVIYPFLLRTNMAYYAVQLDVYPIRSESVDYVRGSTEWGWPDDFITPQFIISSTNSFGF